jgi:hypothetical protein
LQFDNFTVEFNGANLEVDTDGGDIRVGERVVGESATSNAKFNFNWRIKQIEISKKKTNRSKSDDLPTPLSPINNNCV